MNRYFLYAILGTEKIEREVGLDDYVAAERAAGFRGHGPERNRPATAAWSSGNVGGRVEYSPQAPPTE
jgi:hypothetical protein